LKSIHIRQHLGVDGYPIEFLREQGIGQSEEGFVQTRAELQEYPAVLGAVVPVIAERLGLTVTNIERTITPVVKAEALRSTTFGRLLEAGEIVGNNDVTTVSTAEGVRLIAELATTAYEPGDRDWFKTTFDATPRVELSHQLLPGPDAVDGTTVNRIPDVIAAPPGIVSTADLPFARYRLTLAHPNGD
jgi:2,4-diaminopentanoate dehydrogenase